MISNKRLMIFIGISILFLSACNTQLDNVDDAEPASAIISKHVIRFTQPPTRIPAKVSVDAPLLGNGFTGVSIAGNPENQVFYVARNDFWRLTSSHNEAYPCVLGKIEWSVPRLEGASYLIEQHLYDATTTAVFRKEDITVAYKAYVAATEDVFIVEVSMEGEGKVEGNVQLALPGPKEIVESLPLDRAFPEKREQDRVGDIHYISRAFVDSVEIPTKAAIALQVEGFPDGRFTLEQDKPVRFVCAFSSNFKSDDCVAAAINKVKECTSQQLQETEKRHKQWWKNYWEKSFVSIPDTTIERHYYLSLYGMASCSRDTLFPPPIFGTWITQEQPAWAGDYHLNYNHNAPFYALYSANRIEQADPYYRPILAMIPRGNYYSEKITGNPSGIMLPVGIGPLGIETTRWNDVMEKYRKDWRKKGNIEFEGMFWGQKSNSAYAVVNLAMQFYHTYDEDFCRKVYPFVKGVADFWEKYLVYENGRYVDYNDAIHEGTVGDTNPILPLGLIKLVMRTATDMSYLLKDDVSTEESRLYKLVATDLDRPLPEEMDLREKWMHIYSNISEYPLQERNGKTVFRLSEKGTDWWVNNTLAIQHIYPGGQVGLGSKPELLEIARNTMLQMPRWLDGNGSNSFFPAAVRVGFDPDTILYHLASYAEHTFPNGFQLNNPHGIENFSTTPNTINEMLCMGHQGIVRLFPVWPRNLDASFHQIRVEGAFLVSARLKNGEVTDLTIFSEQGSVLYLLNPWKGRKVKITEHLFKEIYEGERIMIGTEAGVTYRFYPV
jgi:hypothetical protein